VLSLFLRALFAYQRRRGRELGMEGHNGAVSFVQRFGSALQMNIHFHVLVPEGLFAAPSPQTSARATFLSLPPPSDEEVDSLLRTVMHRVVRLLTRRGLLEEGTYPDDALGHLQAASLQRRLPLGDEERPPPRKRRCATLEGFSLHANTHVHPNDRQGLEQLCRYGARGPLALERLARREDGRLTYRLKRPAPDGSTYLVLTPLELLRLLAALVPPPRANLVHFHGVMAPNAKLRPQVVPQPPPPTPPLCVQQPSTAPAELKVQKQDRLPWAELLRRTFKVDVLTCSKCGGRRRVIAYITDPPVVRAILDRLGLPSRAFPIAPARDPPQASLSADL
jgi:hypothetical protein